MPSNSLRHVSKWSLVVALVLSTSVIVQAQEAEPQPEAAEEGRIIQIGPEAGLDENSRPKSRADREDRADLDQPALPKQHWIGLRGGPVSPELRAHVDIPTDQGVLAVEVMPDGPAAKAGLKQFDILLRANGSKLHSMNDLVAIVREVDPAIPNQITLEVLRKGQRETIWVTPELRPIQPERPAMREPFGRFGRERNFGGGLGELERLFGGMGLENRRGGLPNGVSISIQKRNNEPTKITVRRGNETWEIIGDDPKSLEKLPEDLRPMVERAMKQRNRPRQLQRNGNNRFNNPFQPQPRPEPEVDELRERLERMEQMFEEFKNKQENKAKE